jgi:hypothetical protein
MATSHAIHVEQIEPRIRLIRGQRDLLDFDLAELYGVTTRRLNEQVRRNPDRFPADFLFRLTSEEKSSLIAEEPHLDQLRFSRTTPLAFTEHGAIMAASVLNSPMAVAVSVLVVWAFVKLRSLLLNHHELAKKFQQLESRLANHDVAIQQLMRAIRQLMDEPAAPPKPRIGFR